MKKQLSILSFLLLLILFNSCQKEKTKKELKKVETFTSVNGKSLKTKNLEVFIKHQMDSLQIPGLSFAIVNNKQIVFLKNLGFFNIKTKQSVMDRSLFDAASISKTVFSFFVMKMTDRGIINLDTPLYKYLENPDISYDERYKKITARMALSHTSGFPNWRYLTNKGYDPEGKLRIEFEPGTQYQYSGEGYQYLAQVMAHLINTDLNGLQEVIKKEVFIPLDMGESSFVWNPYLENYRVMGHKNGKLDKGYSSHSRNPDFNAAASLQTNAEAYANLLIALMNKSFLSKKANNEMLKVQSERLATEKRSGVQYGLGVIINSTNDGTNYAHSGDNESATSQFLFNDTHKSGYVYFMNTSSRKKNVFEKNLNNFLLN